MKTWMLFIAACLLADLCGCSKAEQPGTAHIQDNSGPPSETSPAAILRNDLSPKMTAYVQKLGGKVTDYRIYQEGTTATLILNPFEAAHLRFLENHGGIKDLVILFDQKNVHLVYCFIGEETEINSTFLPAGRNGSRGTGKDAAHLSEWTYKWKLDGDKAAVTFVAQEPSVEFKARLAATAKRNEERKKAEKQILRNAMSAREWDFDEKIAPITIIMDDPNGPDLTRLRTEYSLAELTANGANEYEKLKLILGWTQSRWRHSGSNRPSRSDPLTILKEAGEGKMFRCVEYAIVVAACARSLGMPSRVLGLKREDVETNESGAGHVVAEVWLDQFKKWIFVDGQWGAIVEKDGVPLNAVEFQDAMARKAPGLKIRFSSKTKEEEYRQWIITYLYYFDFNLDQRFFGEKYEERRYAPALGKFMLVPKGAKKPKVFQGKTAIKNCTYLSNPNAFYPAMAGKP